MSSLDKLTELIHLPQELCTMCGKCCRTIFLEMCPTHKDLEQKMQTEPEGYHYFVPISREEVYKISPVYAEGVIKHFQGKGKEVEFYRCRFVTDDNKCSIHQNRPELCRKYPRPHRDAVYHPECGYKEAAEKNWIEIEKILNDLERRQEEIQAEKAKLLSEAKEEYISYYQNAVPALKFKELPQELCYACGRCCKSVVSYLSSEELMQKAKEGSEEAVMFLEIFKPYRTFEEAREDDFENFELIAKRLNFIFKDVTFYRCEFLGEDNLCTIYDNRPRLCQETPYNPWTVMPSTCGFNEWLFEKREQVKKISRKLKELEYHLLELMKSNEFSLSEELRKNIEGIDVYTIDAWGCIDDYFNVSRYMVESSSGLEYENVKEVLEEIRLMVGILDKVYIS